MLDPACGSGNFLYLALHAFKDIEHRVQLEAETLGLQRGFPAVGPANVKWIEIKVDRDQLLRQSPAGSSSSPRRHGGGPEPVRRLMRVMGSRCGVLQAAHQRCAPAAPGLSIPAARGEGRAPGPRVVCGPDLHLGFARACVPLGGDGLSEPPLALVAAVEHDGQPVVHRGDRGSPSLRNAGNLEHRPRCAIHLPGVHRVSPLG